MNPDPLYIDGASVQVGWPVRIRWDDPLYVDEGFDLMDAAIVGTAAWIVALVAVIVALAAAFAAWRLTRA